MMTLAEIKALAMELTDSERAQLASHLLHSLPPPPGLYNEDDGYAEAIRREAEMDADSAMCITLEDLKRSVGR